MLPARLPAAAQRSVVQSLLKAGLLEEVEAKSDYPSWHQTDADQAVALHITYAGLLAIDPGTAASSADAAGQTDTAPSAKPSPSRRGWYWHLSYCQAEIRFAAGCALRFLQPRRTQRLSW